MSKSRTYWATGANLFGAAVGYVPNAKAWKRTIDEHLPKGMSGDLAYPPATLGRATSFVGKRGGLMVLIAVNAERCAKADMNQVAALLAHECVHAWQFIRDHVGEHTPGIETEAHAVQSFLQMCLWSHRHSQRRPWRKGSAG